MSSEALWEVVLFVAVAVTLGSIHLWNDDRTRRHKAAAKEALRLDELRQRAVKQLKFEQRAWSARSGQEDAQLTQSASPKDMLV